MHIWKLCKFFTLDRFQEVHYFSSLKNVALTLEKSNHLSMKARFDKYVYKVWHFLHSSDSFVQNIYHAHKFAVWLGVVWGHIA